MIKKVDLSREYFGVHLLAEGILRDQDELSALASSTIYTLSKGLCLGLVHNTTLLFVCKAMSGCAVYYVHPYVNAALGYAWLCAY